MKKILLIFWAALAGGLSASNGLPEPYVLTSVDVHFEEGVIRRCYSGATDIVIPSELRGESVVGIGKNAFRRKRLTDVVIPDSVLIIGDYAFRHNRLTSVKIPVSGTAIGYGVFANNKLTNATIPASVTKIGYQAFTRNLLTQVNLKQGTEITESSFDEGVEIVWSE